MIENNVPPHLTISSFETRKPDNLKEEFMKLNKIGAGEINIFSIGQFLPYVMYATPVLDEYLMHLSNEVYDIFSAREDVTINRCYKPYNWFPHITLGKKLEKEQMIEVKTREEVVALFYAKMGLDKKLIKKNLKSKQ